MTVSQTKFDYCVQSFLQEIDVKVLDLTRNPPTNDPYENLKDRLHRMFSLNNYVQAEVIANLPLTGNMQPSTLMSRMLRLLPAGHAPCFFLQAVFLKRRPADVRAHLVHNRTLDPLTLALHADKIFRSCVSSASTENHVSSTSVLGEKFLIHAISPQASPCSPCSSTPGPSSRRAPAAPSTSCYYASPSLFWYHRSHGDQAQKCQAPCSWSGN